MTAEYKAIQTRNPIQKFVSHFLLPNNIPNPDPRQKLQHPGKKKLFIGWFQLFVSSLVYLHWIFHTVEKSLRNSLKKSIDVIVSKVTKQTVYQFFKIETRENSKPILIFFVDRYVILFANNIAGHTFGSGVCDIVSTAKNLCPSQSNFSTVYGHS